jgi:hypothetical protein
MAALAGCQASPDDLFVPTPPAFTPNAVMGGLTFDEVKLLGPDANQNGVRDGVDLAISQQVAGNLAQAAAIRYAQRITATLIAGHRDNSANVDDIRAYQHARYCLIATGVPTQWISNLPAHIINTPSRRAAAHQWRQDAVPVDPHTYYPCE